MMTLAVVLGRIHCAGAGGRASRPVRSYSSSDTRLLRKREKEIKKEGWVGEGILRNGGKRADGNTHWRLVAFRDKGMTFYVLA